MKSSNFIVMKKIFIFLMMIIYLITIIIFREYRESHICSFLIGASCALTVVFFMYLVDKKQNLKNK